MAEFLQDAIPPPVYMAISRGWTMLADLTDAGNGSVPSLAVRVGLTAFSYAFCYTQSVGLLMMAVAFLVEHHWYLLAVSCSVVILLISSVALISYEWMWQWQGKMVLFFHGSNRGRRQLIVDDDDADEALFESWQVWSKRLGRAALIILGWTFYCWINIKLDHFLFWSQYSSSHPNQGGKAFSMASSASAAPKQATKRRHVRSDDGLRNMMKTIV